VASSSELAGARSRNRLDRARATGRQDAEKLTRGGNESIGSAMYRHALLLGCTGMLRRASIAIAQTSLEVTSVASTRRSLEAVDRDIQPRVRHHMLALDWSDGARYVAKVVDHIRRSLEPDLVVAWVHDDGVARRILEDLSAEAIACDFLPRRWELPREAQRRRRQAADAARRARRRPIPPGDPRRSSRRTHSSLADSCGDLRWCARSHRHRSAVAHSGNRSCLAASRLVLPRTLRTPLIVAVLRELYSRCLVWVRA
jgi:hypothetical protein